MIKEKARDNSVSIQLDKIAYSIAILHDFSYYSQHSLLHLIEGALLECPGCRFVTTTAELPGDFVAVHVATTPKAKLESTAKLTDKNDSGLRARD